MQSAGCQLDIDVTSWSALWLWLSMSSHTDIISGWGFLCIKVGRRAWGLTNTVIGTSKSILEWSWAGSRGRLRFWVMQPDYHYGTSGWGQTRLRSCSLPRLEALFTLNNCSLLSSLVASFTYHPNFLYSYQKLLFDVYLGFLCSYTLALGLTIVLCKLAAAGSKTGQLDNWPIAIPHSIRSQILLYINSLYSSAFIFTHTIRKIAGVTIGPGHCCRYHDRWEHPSAALAEILPTGTEYYYLYTYITASDDNPAGLQITPAAIPHTRWLLTVDCWTVVVLYRQPRLLGQCFPELVKLCARQHISPNSSPPRSRSLGLLSHF